MEEQTIFAARACLICFLLVVVGGCCDAPRSTQPAPLPTFEVPAAPAPTKREPTIEEEQTRFDAAKAKLKAKRPTNEKQIKAILGEPSNTMQDFMGKGDMVQWYFETHKIGRDVIQCLIHKDGGISMLSY